MSQSLQAEQHFFVLVPHTLHIRLEPMTIVCVFGNMWRRFRTNWGRGKSAPTGNVSSGLGLRNRGDGPGQPPGQRASDPGRSTKAPTWMAWTWAGVCGHGNGWEKAGAMDSWTCT